MNKKILFPKFLLMPFIFMLLFLLSTEYASSEMFETGIGASTSSTNYFPYYFYNYARARTLYPANELWGEEGEIYSFSFYITSASVSSGMNNFAIYMRNCGDSTAYNNISAVIDTSASSGFVRVYSASLFAPVASDVNEWYTFDFETPFFYEGNSLEIVIVHNDGSYSNNTNFSVRTYYTGSHRRLNYAYSDSPGSPTNYSSAMNYAVSARFEYEASKMKYLRTEINTPEIQQISDVQYNLLQFNVVTEKFKDPLTVNNLIIDLLGTDLDVDIEKIEVYCTYGSDLFALGAPVGTLTNVDLFSKNRIIFDTPVTLGEGYNYFWITCTVNPANTLGDRVLDANLLQLSINGVYKDTEEEYTNTEGEAHINYTPIELLDVQTSYTLCSTHPPKPITVLSRGTVIGYIWERWNDALSAYEVIPNATTNTYSVITEEVMSGYDLYRFTAVSPKGGNETIVNQSVEISFDYDMDLEYAKIYDNGILVDEEDLYILCVGDEVILTSEIVGDYKELIWQYSTDNINWFNISLIDMPTANTPTLKFIADERYKNSKIRLSVLGTDACGTIVYSNSMSVNVFMDPLFVTQPSSASLCAGEDFYTALNFSGEEPIYQMWYKDGVPLGDENDTIYNKQELEFTNVDVNLAGSYYYFIRVETCYGIVEMVSDTIIISVFPNTEVHNITKGNVRSNEGETAILEVEASYVPTELYPRGQFQWYRYDVLTNTSIPLENSYKIKGAQSTVLVINYITLADYTFNGSYYYCRVSGKCGSSVDSDPIMLIPSEQIKIIKQPESLTVCSTVGLVTLSTQVFSSEDNSKLRYQWYYDNTALIDGGDYTGVDTKELNVTINSSTKYPMPFYCKIWLEGNDPNLDFIKTSEVIIDVLEDYQPELSSSTLNGDPVLLDGLTTSLTVGSELNIHIETLNPNTDIIHWAKRNSVSGEYDLLGLSGNDFVIPSLSLTDAGDYAIIIKNECETATLLIEFVLEVEEFIDETTNTGISILSIDNIELLPNPVTSILQVKYLSSLSSETELTILDLCGSVLYKTLLHSTIGLNEFTIDFNKLHISNGSYFVRINSRDNFIIKSFVLSK